MRNTKVDCIWRGRHCIRRGVRDMRKQLRCHTSVAWATLVAIPNRSSTTPLCGYLVLLNCIRSYPQYAILLDGSPAHPVLVIPDYALGIVQQTEPSSVVPIPLYEMQPGEEWQGMVSLMYHTSTGSVECDLSPARGNPHNLIEITLPQLVVESSYSHSGNIVTAGSDARALLLTVMWNDEEGRRLYGIPLTLLLAIVSNVDLSAVDANGSCIQLTPRHWQVTEFNSFVLDCGGDHDTHGADDPTTTLPERNAERPGKTTSDETLDKNVRLITQIRDGPGRCSAHAVGSGVLYGGAVGPVALSSDSQDFLRYFVAPSCLCPGDDGVWAWKRVLPRISSYESRGGRGAQATSRKR